LPALYYSIEKRGRVNKAAIAIELQELDEHDHALQLREEHDRELRELREQQNNSDTHKQ
jgi:hypothetical protein